MEPSLIHPSPHLQNRKCSAMENTTVGPDRKPSPVAEDVELHCLLGALWYVGKREKVKVRILSRNFLIGLVKARLDWVVG